MGKVYSSKKIILTALVYLVCGVGIIILLWSSHNYTYKQLTISQVKICGGNTHLKQVVNNHLQQYCGHSIKNIKSHLGQLRSEIISLPMVANAAIGIKYPNTILVKLVPNNPVFIWQNADDEFYLIDSENKVLRRAKLQDYKHLLLIKGKELPIRASEDVRYYLYQYPQLAKHSYSLNFNGYTWDLILRNNILIKLPKDDIPNALYFILKVNQKYQLFNRQIEYIDARVNKKLFIKPKQEALFAKGK